MLHRHRMQGHDMEDIDYNNAAAVYRCIVGPALMGCGLAGLTWLRLGIPYLVLTVSAVLGLVKPCAEFSFFAEPLAAVCMSVFAAGELCLRRRFPDSSGRILDKDLKEAKLALCFLLFIAGINDPNLFCSYEWKVWLWAILGTLAAAGLILTVYKTAKLFNTVMNYDINVIVLTGSLISILAPAVPWVYYPIMIGIGVWIVWRIKNH